MVTLTPSMAAMQASSQPMNPPPMTIMEAGNFWISRNARLSATRSCFGKKPGIAEVEPVAMMIFFVEMRLAGTLAPKTWLMIGPPEISIVLRSTKLAVPVNCFTPLAVSSELMPLRNVPTALSLLPIITE